MSPIIEFVSTTGDPVYIDVRDIAVVIGDSLSTLRSYVHMKNGVAFHIQLEADAVASVWKERL